MRVTCECGRRLNVPASAAGRKGKCPACGAIFEIPEESLLEEAPAIEADLAALIRKVSDLEEAQLTASRELQALHDSVEQRLTDQESEPAPSPILQEDLEAQFMTREQTRTEVTAQLATVKSRVRALEAGDEIQGTLTDLEGRMSELGARLDALQEQIADGPTRGPIETESLTLRDAEGRRRLTLQADSSGPCRITFLDGDGRQRAVLGLAADGSGHLGFLDGEGAVTLTLGLGLDGQVSLNLFDSGSNPRAVLGLGPEGQPGLSLFDEQGIVVWKGPDTR